MGYKLVFAALLCVLCALFLLGCAGQQPNNGQPGAAIPQNGQLGNGAQPTTAVNDSFIAPDSGIGNDLNDTLGNMNDTDGAGYTDVPVDDGSGS